MSGRTRCFVRWAGRTALFAALLFAPPAGAAEPLSFVALGDIPYLTWSEDGADIVDDAQGRVLVRQIIPAIRAAKPPFVLHYGDVKAGGASCTDALLTERLAQIRAIAPGRTVFTPGDNDWTDCDRERLAQPFSELERLATLRRLAYGGEDMAGALKPVRQPLYPENARWTADGIVFASLHVVGTNNGRRQILMDDTRMALAQVDARDAANEAWIDAAFDAARAADARMLVFVFQADVFKRRGLRCTALSREACDGHAWLRDKLKGVAAAFDKPVLLIHGDTDDHCLDRPMRDAPGLWRLNGPGDRWTGPAGTGGGLLDAVQVTLTPEADPPVSARYLLSGEPPPESCGF